MEILQMVWLILVVGCLGVIAAVVNHVNTRPQQPRGAAFLLLVTVLCIAAQTALSWWADSASGQEASQQRAIVQPTGKLRHPSAYTDGDLMELVLGNNVVSCPPGLEVDLGQAVDVLGPYLNVMNRGNRLFVSATLLDPDGQVLAIIEENEFKVTPKEDVRIETSPNRVSVTDPSGTVLLDVVMESARRARVEGVFYTPLYKCVINTEGFICDAISPQAPVKQLVIKNAKLNRFGKAKVIQMQP